MLNLSPITKALGGLFLTTVPAHSLEAHSQTAEDVITLSRDSLPEIPEEPDSSMKIHGADRPPLSGERLEATKTVVQEQSAKVAQDLLSIWDISKLFGATVDPDILNDVGGKLEQFNELFDYAVEAASLADSGLLPKPKVNLMAGSGTLVEAIQAQRGRIEHASLNPEVAEGAPPMPTPLEVIAAQAPKIEQALLHLEARCASLKQLIEIRYQFKEATARCAAVMQSSRLISNALIETAEAVPVYPYNIELYKAFIQIETGFVPEMQGLSGALGRKYKDASEEIKRRKQFLQNGISNVALATDLRYEERESLLLRFRGLDQDINGQRADNDANEKQIESCAVQEQKLRFEKQGLVDSLPSLRAEVAAKIKAAEDSLAQFYKNYNRCPLRNDWEHCTSHPEMKDQYIKENAWVVSSIHYTINTEPERIQKRENEIKNLDHHIAKNLEQKHLEERKLREGRERQAQLEQERKALQDRNNLGENPNLQLKEELDRLKQLKERLEKLRSHTANLS